MNLDYFIPMFYLKYGASSSWVGYVSLITTQKSICVAGHFPTLQEIHFPEWGKVTMEIELKDNKVLLFLRHHSGYGGGRVITDKKSLEYIKGVLGDLLEQEPSSVYSVTTRTL